MARFALLFALALTICAHALSAQDAGRLEPVHVLPPDSAGFIARRQLELFRLNLPRLEFPPGPVVPWEALPGTSRVAGTLARFDTTVALSREANDADAQRRHLMRQFGYRTAAADTVPEARRGLFGFSSKTAEVTFEGSLQFQISTTRQKNLACTAVDLQNVASGCTGGFKSPTIENTVLLQSHGVFAQRMNVNLDFDSKRDYGAGQIVNVYYLGLEDEKLQRVDVGTVQWVAPASRYFTSTIPSNNFGISARAVFGPVEVRGILAAQKGSVVANHSYTIGTGVVAPQDITKRDLDYEAQRVFWVVDPRNLPAYPALDILSAANIPVSADSQPSDVRIYRYVAGNLSSGANANYDGITASGSNGSENVGALRWRLLKRNIDYWIDPSGLWFALTNAINPSDYLAVSYSTKGGGKVGTLPTVDDSTKHDQLRLIYLPNKGPASPLFYYEMRQVYHIAGASLVRTSVKTQLLVAGSERPDSAPGTFLSVLGLALPSEQATFDYDNRVFPRLRDPGARQVILDNLLVFPSARPFSDPRLSARERNDSLYVTPEYLLLSQGPPSKFQLHLQFDATGGSDRSSITLDGFQITEGSEHIDVGGRRLVKEKDYTIDYATGRVNFLDPNELFGNGTAQVNATFEQRGLFAIAPTTIAGVTATWNLGVGKSVSLSALYQAEATGYTRPQIGYEAHASLLAGLTADFTFNSPWLTRLVNRVITKPSTAPSFLRFSGEAAISRPDPNRSGDAYLEQFEDDRSILIQASQNRWVPGSVPKSNAGLLDVLPRGFDSSEAVQLGVQNLVQNSGQAGIVQYSPHDIDATVALTQSKVPSYEPVLWTTLHADTAGGIVDRENRSHWTQPERPNRPRWAAMTTSLSPTGLDLTRNDYFEFAVYQTRDTIVKQAGMRIVIDLGRVSEDALSVAPTAFHVLQTDSLKTRFVAGDTIYTGRQYIGVGRLDTERNSFGAWNALDDDVGILADRPDSLLGPNGTILRRPALCTDNLSASVTLYRWGDLGARCTNRNSNPDTEDLDGDNILDAQGPNDDVFRYVINLATDSARYFVRQTQVFPDSAHLDVAHSATWTIYRIPLAGAHDTVGSPDMHLIKQMRMTYVAPAVPQGQEKVVFVAFARMRFSGASWVARAPRPIATLSGAKAEQNGTVLIGSVTTQDGFVDSSHVAQGYTSPPGIGDAAATTAVSSADFSQQINEKSLSITATNLQVGQRAEAYLRQVAGAWNLLAYNQLRVWVHGGARAKQPVAPGWDDGRLRAYVKLGSDAYNFYMYSAPARTGTWDPEMVIDLQVWKDLRAQIENARLKNPNTPSGYVECGSIGDPNAWFACTPDGYFVQIRDPQINPPNLAAVQELAAGIYYPGTTGLPIASTELWVDDIRVGLPVSQIGVVAALSAHAQVADIATLDLAGAFQSGSFHQLAQLPSYQNVTTFSAVSVVRVDRFLPTNWGLIIPATVSSNHGWVNPDLISGTDVQGSAIDGLRRPSSDATQWNISIRHPNRQNEPNLSRLVLSPLSLTASGAVASNVAALSEASTSAWSTTLGYTLGNRRRAWAMHLKGLVAGLPKWLRESSAGQGLANAAFAPVPTLLSFTSTISHTMGDLQTYQVPIHILADTILKPVTSEQFLWRNTAGMNWEPFTMLTLTSNWSSTRDLRQYADSTSLARVANAQHELLFGADIGVERDRTLSNSLVFAPHLVSWLGTSATVGSNFVLSRSLTSRNPVRIDGDTAGRYILPQTLNDSRQISYRVSVDARTLAKRVFGDSSKVSRALVQMQPIILTRTHTLESTFDLAHFDPDLGYQLALGGFDSFLSRNGEQAIYAGDATATTVAATVDLPFGLSAQANYTETVMDRYEHQVGTSFLKTTGTNESWPSGRFTWSETFARGPILRITAATNVQRDRATSSSPFTDGTGAVATSDTRSTAPDLTVTLRNAAFVRLSGRFDHSDASYGGNLTQTDAATVSGSVSWTVRMPRFISGQRRNLTTDVSVTENTSSSCIQRTSDSACVATYDLSRFEARTSFRASLPHAIQAGLNFSYVHNAVKSLGQLTSTITLSALINIPLSSLGM